ncbi:hypothetical protein cypCar_00004109 [Cyprinus carpio]|nr:hypothetical protein cypCar_00004109 [Cyprinus carpio]
MKAASRGHREKQMEKAMLNLHLNQLGTPARSQALLLCFIYSSSRENSCVGPRSSATDRELISLEETALENTDSDIGLCGWILVLFSILLTLLTLPLSIWMCIKIVKEYERAIIFRLGRILRGGAKGPGLFFILPCTDSFINVDMRTITFDIPPQEVLTKDSVTVSVDGVVYYRVQNATLAVANITNADAATRLLAQTTLRNVLGTKNLAEILSDREEIAHSMQSTLDDATDDWGIKVERVEIKDVKLPLQLQRAMAAEAEATREARAKLRYLQTLNTIAAEKNSTIIFPLPIDMMQSFMKH